jgi:hypothetical protein
MGGEVFLTVLSGVTVFVAGQIFIKFVIDPINDFYKLTGEIGHSLIYYANVYSNTKLAKPEAVEEADRLFRRQSSDLFARAYAIPLLSVWATVHLLPPRRDLMKAADNLIGLANGVHDTTDKAYEANMKRRMAIERQLRMQTDIDE